MDVGRARHQGVLVDLDAHQALAALTVDGVPDQGRFREVIGDVVGDAAARGRRVRGFGEMVGVLWAQGDVAGALALESFWNDLGALHDLSLWCAYPTTFLPDAELDAVADLCAHHSRILASPTDAPVAVVEGSDGSGPGVSQLFLPVPAAAGAVRLFVTRTLESWGAGALTGDAAIVASELANNAILHAASPFRVTVSRSGAVVTLAVTDCDATPPRRSYRGMEALGGRGIVIVDGVSEQWGTDAGAGGKTVWATLTPAP